MSDNLREIYGPGESSVAIAAREAKRLAEIAAGQTNADAQAVETARGQVEGINTALPGRVATELTEQVPAAVAEQVATRVDPKVAAAEASRVAAAVSEQNAASMATLNGSFTTLALATAAVASLPEGHSYEVTADGTNTGIWTKRSGVLVQTSTVTVGAVSSRVAVVEGVVKAVDLDGITLDGISVPFIADDGTVFGGFGPDGRIKGSADFRSMTAADAAFGGARFSTALDYEVPGIAVPFCLPDGRVFGGVRTDGTIVGSGGGGGGSVGPITDDEYNELSARGYAYAAQWRARPVSGYANFRTDLLCHVVSDGQSFSNGTNGYPVNGNSLRAGIYMIGDSVHGTAAVSGGGTCEPYQWNGSAFVAGSVVLKAHAYTRAPNFRGQTPGESALDYLRRGFDERFGPGYSTAKWVYSTGGVGGTSIAQHLPGAAEKYAEYFQSVVAYGKTAATNEGLTYQLTAVPLLIGQTDARSLEGGQNKRAWYKARVVEWYEGTVLPSCTGQALKPLVFADQVSGSYNRDSGFDGGVALAQIELARDYPWFVLWGGSAPYLNDATGHLNANGYDAHGQMLGVAMEQALLHGVRMCPLQPVSLVRRGAEVCISWTEDVEVGTVYGVLATVDAPTGLGLDLFDDAGALTIAALTIDRNLVKITASRAVVGALYVRNGSEAVGGNTWLRGKAPLGVPSMAYANSGVVGLDGTPYPTKAIALSFTLPATAI